MRTKKTKMFITTLFLLVTMIMSQMFLGITQNQVFSAGAKDLSPSLNEVKVTLTAMKQDLSMVTIIKDNVPTNPVPNVSPGDRIYLELAWDIDEWRDENGDPTTAKENDYFNIKLPEGIEFEFEDNPEVDLVQASNTSMVLGKWSIKNIAPDGDPKEFIVHTKLTAYGSEHPALFDGMYKVQGKVIAKSGDIIDVDSGGEVIKIPVLPDNIPIIPIDPLKIWKNGYQYPNSNNVEFIIRINTDGIKKMFEGNASDTLNSIEITDTLQNGLKYIPGSVRVYIPIWVPITGPSFNDVGNKAFTWLVDINDIPSWVPGWDFSISPSTSSPPQEELTIKLGNLPSGMTYSALGINITPTVLEARDKELYDSLDQAQIDKIIAVYKDAPVTSYSISFKAEIDKTVITPSTDIINKAEIKYTGGTPETSEIKIKFKDAIGSADVPIGTIVLEKEDKDNPLIGLEGAEFKFTYKDGTEVKDKNGDPVGPDFKTNANGLIEIRNLNPGTYKFVETKAPPGYKLDPTPFVVIVKANAVAGVFVIKTNEKESNPPTPPIDPPVWPVDPIDPSVWPITPIWPSIILKPELTDIVPNTSSRIDVVGHLKSVKDISNKIKKSMW